MRPSRLAPTMALLASAAMALATLPAGEAHATSLTLSAGEALDGTELELLVDGRTGRAFLAAPAGDAPVVITAHFDRARWLARVRLDVGDTRSNRTWSRHARPAVITLAWDGGERRFEVEDSRSRQTLELGRLALTTRLVLTVHEVHGDASDGVAIAELGFGDHWDPVQTNPDLFRRIERQVLALGSSDPGLEARARHYLGRFGEQAAPSLTRAVAEGEEPLATRALEVLFDVGGAWALDVAADLFASGHQGVERALAALELHPALSGVEPMLVSLLAADDAGLARRALVVLARGGTAVGVEQVAAALADRDEAQAQAGQLAFASLPPASARALAQRLLASGDAQSIGAAFGALAAIAQADRATLSFIVEGARAADRTTRLAAITALGRVPLAASRAALEELLASDESATARRAVEALVAHGEGGVRRLAELRDSLPQPLVAHAVEAMHASPTTAATDFLVRALAGGVWTPWYGRASWALGRRGEEGVQAVIDWLWERPGDVRAMRQFLVDNGHLASAPASAFLRRLLGGIHRDHIDAQVLLLELIRDAGARGGADFDVVLETYRRASSAIHVRRAAFDALAHLGRRDTLAPLILEALEDPDTTLRRLAFHAVARHRVEAALPVVERAIADTRPGVWDPGVVTAYGTIGGPEALAILRRNYALASHVTRLAILDVAWRSGTPAGFELLVDATSSPDREVRRVAQALLVRDL